MISRIVQELACWQRNMPANRHYWKQYHLRYAITAWVVITLWWFSTTCYWQARLLWCSKKGFTTNKVNQWLTIDWTINTNGGSYLESHGQIRISYWYALGITDMALMLGTLASHRKDKGLRPEDQLQWNAVQTMYIFAPTYKNEIMTVKSRNLTISSNYCKCNPLLCISLNHTPMQQQNYYYIWI